MRRAQATKHEAEPRFRFITVSNIGENRRRRATLFSDRRPVRDLRGRVRRRTL